MTFLNWPKVLMTIKRLNELNSLPYFDLGKFCLTHDLDYEKISHFMEISNGIIDGTSDLIKALEKDKEHLNNLINLDPKYLKINAFA